MAFRDDLLLLQRDAHIAKAKRTLVLGWVLIGLAIGLGITPLHLMLTGENTSAVLVVLESTTERGLFGETKRIYPHVKFTTPSGNTVVFKDRFSDEQPPWEVGDKINVLYFPDAPQEAMIDRWVRNFSPSDRWPLNGAILSLIFDCLVKHRLLKESVDHHISLPLTGRAIRVHWN